MPEEYKAPETDEGLKLTAREAEQLVDALGDPAYADLDARVAWHAVAGWSVLNPEFLPGGGLPL